MDRRAFFKALATFATALALRPLLPKTDPSWIKVPAHMIYPMGDVLDMQVFSDRAFGDDYSREVAIWDRPLTGMEIVYITAIKR